MLKNLQVLFILTLFSTSVFSQEMMTLTDQKNIPSTSIWSFRSDSYSYSGYAELQVGNNGKGGTVLIQIETSDPTFYIGGTVYLFLEDGNVITCTDKNVRSISGKKVQSYYIITPTEVNLLKRNKLTDVRFRVNGNATQFSSPTGFFTASNKIRTFGLPDKTYDTQTEINQLFLK